MQDEGLYHFCAPCVFYKLGRCKQNLQGGIGSLREGHCSAAIIAGLRVNMHLNYIAIREDETNTQHPKNEGLPALLAGMTELKEKQQRRVLGLIESKTPRPAPQPPKT